MRTRTKAYWLMAIGLFCILLRAITILLTPAADLTVIMAFFGVGCFTAGFLILMWSIAGRKNDSKENDPSHCNGLP